MRKIRHKYSTTITPALSHNGTIELDQTKVAELMAKHYQDVSSNDGFSQQFQRIRRAKESLCLNFASNRNNREEYNKEITLIEMKTALSQCSNTAPGPDGIHYQMLRPMSDTATGLLLQIYNIVWLHGLFPSLWGKATILSFLKPGKPRNEATSFRPIALTSCVCKLLEKIVVIV